jgi:hypothetical protein
MRAKNEFRLISEAYDIKLLAEKAVDGTLMCSKDCCGSPVMECKCGDDCKHCNCFMIQKAVKDFGLKSPLLEAVGHYDTHVRLSRGGKWNTHTVSVRKTDKELIQKFLDQGFKIEKPPEDGEDDPYNVLNELEKEFERELEGGGDGIDTNVNELKDIIDSIKGLDGISEEWREGSLKYLKNLKGPGGRVGLEDVDFEFVFGEEDNEEPKRGISGLNPRRSPELHSMKSHAIDKIDLNKWREYPAEDVMKAVYRRYGKDIPSVDSYDWAITWDKKVRPWLKEHEGNL